ncbi:MAG TPA: DinB family protein, partial [Bacteroidia bacterium]|nr:DinB family protein [Bacteroidia bacterium]
MSGNLLLRYANYNKWANQRITNAIVSAGETVADTEMKSSFNTVRKTIYHIYDSQHTWIMRIQNKPYSWPPSKDFKGDLNEFSKLLIESSQEWINYISNLNDEDFKKIIWDFADQLKEELKEQKKLDSHVDNNLKSLRDAVESNS